MRVVPVLYACIVILDFFPADPFVKVYCRKTYNVALAAGGTALEPVLPVIDKVKYLTVVCVHRLHQACEVLPAAGRKELVLGVVMVHSVGEEDPLCIYFKILVPGAFPVSCVLADYFLQHPPELEVAGAVLVPVDVASPFGRLGKVIYILLLLKAELLPSRDGVPNHLDVCKFIKKIPEAFHLVVLK